MAQVLVQVMVVQLNLVQVVERVVAQEQDMVMVQDMVVVQVPILGRLSRKCCKQSKRIIVVHNLTKVKVLKQMI